jgi:hypothetical protein
MKSKRRASMTGKTALLWVVSEVQVSALLLRSASGVR